MIYLDILGNEYDDYVLYLNGEEYQDIDYRWVDCLLYLQNILEGKVKIQLRETDKERQDFPDIIENYKDIEMIWRRINLKDIEYYLNKKAIKWTNGDKLFIIEPTDKLPDFLAFETLTTGSWYVLESNI